MIDIIIGQEYVSRCNTETFYFKVLTETSTSYGMKLMCPTEDDLNSFSKNSNIHRNARKLTIIEKMLYL